MNTPSSRARKIAYYSAGPLALLVAGGMVWQGSQAAFTASTRNAGNSWSTGNVMLTDDGRGSRHLRPGPRPGFPGMTGWRRGSGDPGGGTDTEDRACRRQ